MSCSPAENFPVDTSTPTGLTEDSTEYVRLRPAGPEDAFRLSLIGSAAFLEAFTWMLPGKDILAFCAKNHTPEAYAHYLAEPDTRITLAETATGAPVGYAMLTMPDLPTFDVLPSDIELKRIYLLSRFRSLMTPVLVPLSRIDLSFRTLSERSESKGEESASAPAHLSSQTTTLSSRPEHGGPTVVRSGEISVLAPAHLSGQPPTIPNLRPGQALLDAAIADARTMGRKRLLLGTHASNERAISFYRRNGFTAAGTRTFQVGAQCCCDYIFAKSL